MTTDLWGPDARRAAVRGRVLLLPEIAHGRDPGPFDAAISLLVEARAAREARRFIRSQATSWCFAPDTVEVAELLAGELSANAVRHATRPGPIEVRLSYERPFPQPSRGLRAPFPGADAGPDAEPAEGLLKCEVADHTETMPEPSAEPPGGLGESGRGLFLVDVLSHDWGCRRTSTGKVVWFTLRAVPRRAS